MLCFDADSAGVKACERAFRELAPEGLLVKVVELPAGEDPDTFLKSNGADAFRGKVETARDFFDFKISFAKTNGALEAAEGRAQMARDCTELLAAMGDHAARDQQINVVATMLGLGSSTLREGIVTAVRKAKVQAQRPVRGQQETEPEIVITPVPLDRTVGYLCHLALTSAPAQHFLSEQFETLHEAKAWVEGVGLLEKILAASPDPGSSAAVNTFIAGFRKGEQMAINRLMGAGEPVPADGLQEAERALGMLSALVLQKRDAAVSAAIVDPQISPERMKVLLEEKKAIALLQKGMARFIRNDQLPDQTIKAEKKPWEKWKK